MTICIDVGKFQTTIHHQGAFGYSAAKVELSINWVSCGYYTITDGRIHLHLAPEWIEKVVELFPKVEKPPRSDLYKPFFEDFHTDAGMIDTGNDMLFQAFKHQTGDRVIITNYHFQYGVPSELNVFNIAFDEFVRLKTMLDGVDIFYSGVNLDLPSVSST